MPEHLYLEDLTVGQRFTSGSYRLELDELTGFARAYDPQPFHLDAEAAGAGPFAGLAASGWQTAAITMRLLVGGGAPFAGGVVGAGAELTWLKPVRPGDTLTVETEIVSMRPSRSRPDRGIVVLRSDTMNQAGEPVERLVSTVIVPRRGSVAER